MDGVSSTEAAGATVFRCPECGRETKDERRLLRTRRRWRWATLSVLLVLLALAAGATPKIRREGWGVISTRQLVELVPIWGYDGPFGQELMRRLGMTGPRSWTYPIPMRDEDQAYVARRLGEGNILARPMSDRWKASYGRIIREAGNSVFELPAGRGLPMAKAVEDAARTWYSLPPETHFRTRPRWPAGYNIWVEASEKTYWPWPTPLGMEIRRTGSEGAFRDIAPDYGWTCKEREAGSGVLRFDVKLWQLRQGDWNRERDTEIPRVDLGTLKVEIPYVIGGAMDEVMTPVESPVLDKMMGSLQYRVGPGWVDAGTHNIIGGAAEGIAFGAIFEFRLDGELIARERQWWDGTRGDPAERNGGSEWVRVDPAPAHFKSPWDATPSEHWIITIKSDPETALRLIDRSNYWKGEVQVPLVVQRR